MKEIQQAKNVVEKFYFVFQPIMKLLSETEQELYSYEILLRSKETHSFPAKEFNTLIEEEASNRVLFEWYAKELPGYLERYPDIQFDLNIHPQQFVYDSTWTFLEQIAPYKKQLKIELTELPPMFKYIEDYDGNNVNQHLTAVSKAGYRLAIDDIGSGQNTLDLVAKNLENIACFKFSLLAFRTLDFETKMDFLQVWKKFAQKYNYSFIVEGIDDEKMMKHLYQNDVVLQQGYYWSKPIRL